MSNDEPRSPSYRTVFWYGVVAALGLLTVFMGAAAVYAVRAILVQVIIALFIAVSLDPAVRFMIRRRIKRSQAVTIILMTLLSVIALLLWAVLPSLIHQGTSLTTDFPGYLNHLREHSQSVRHLEDRFNLQGKINQYAGTLPGKLGKEALSFGRRFLGALVSGLLVLVLTIYFMLDLPRLRRNIVRLFPKRHRPSASRVADVLVDKVGSYMIGNLIISAFAAVATFVACLVLRVPFALPLAVFVALMDLLPMVGATIGAVVTVIVAFATTDLWPNTILLAVFFVLYQQLENYLIAPRVLRNAVQMPAVAVLLAALVGGSVLGLIGAVMAIPVAAAVKVLMAPVLRAREEADTSRPLGSPPPPVPERGWRRFDPRRGSWPTWATSRGKLVPAAAVARPTSAPPAPAPAPAQAMPADGGSFAPGPASAGAGEAVPTTLNDDGRI